MTKRGPRASTYTIDATGTQDTFPFLLVSDPHIGHPKFNKELFTYDMEWALAHSAPVFIIGDIMDLILPSDRKRSTPGVHDLGSTSNVLDAYIKRAFTLLQPYADVIQMIGVGNHETAVIKHHHTDPIHTLITQLNAIRNTSLPPIDHGGYRGFLSLKFHLTTTQTRRYVIYYFHGTGGAAPMTDGWIGMKRLANWVIADLIWSAHVHKSITGELPPMRSLDHNDHHIEHQRKGVITGTYLDNMRTHDPNVHGYELDWAEEKMTMPQAMSGGAQLYIHPTPTAIEGKILL